MERVAWITGGGTGIGRELALRLASHGWTVAVSGRRPDKLGEVAALGTASRIHAYPLDVTDRDANRKVAADIATELGPVDLVVLNAGMWAPFKVSEFDAGPFEEMMRLNFLGVVYGIEAVLPAMRERRSGHVAIVSSVAGFSGLPMAAPYGATKAALINLAESLRFSFDRMGVRISVINPGFIRTPLTEHNTFHMPFLMEADEAAARIERGLEAGKFEITFPRRFSLLLKFFRILPYWLHYPVMKAFTAPGRRR